VIHTYVINTRKVGTLHAREIDFQFLGIGMDRKTSGAKQSLIPARGLHGLHLQLQAGPFPLSLFGLADQDHRAWLSTLRMRGADVRRCP